MNAGVRQRGGAFGDVPFEASTPANPHPFGPGPSPNASVLGTSMAVGGQQGSKSGDTPSFERHASVLPAIYPAETLITVHEEHGELIAVPEAQADTRRDEYIKSFPPIHLKRGYVAGESAALKVLGGPASPPATGTKLSAADTAADLVTRILTTCRQIVGLAPPPLHGSSVEAGHGPAQWLSPQEDDACPIHAYASHPLLQKFAIARFDSAVEVHTAANLPHEILIHEAQIGVTDLAWCPSTTSRLAVGCSTGFIIWEVPAISHRQAVEPAVARLYPGAAATTLSWSPFGDLLAVGSSDSNTIRVWDVARSVSTDFVRPGNTARLLWSADGKRLLQTTTSAIFRVWETRTWTCERWETPAGTRCQTACWGSSGQVLLLSMSGESVIYSLQFDDSLRSVLFPVFDTESAMIDTDVCESSVGGAIEFMAWDETNERLAVSFAACADSCPLVAMFRTHLRYASAHPEVIPSGFIRGEPGRFPQRIEFIKRSCFATGSPNLGAVLSICWVHTRTASSTERRCKFGFVPMYFSSEISRRQPQQPQPQQQQGFQAPGGW